MKKASCLIAAFAALGILAFTTPVAEGALTDAESFNYSGTTLNGQNGGTGWNGGWIATGTSPSIELSNDGVSLVHSGVPTSSGSRVSTGGLSANAGSTRLLSETVDLSGEGNVAYASALFRKNAPNGGGVNNDNILIEFTDALGNRRWGFGIAGNGDFPWLNHNGSTPAANSVVPGETYLIVTKVISHATDPDEYFLKVFGPGYATEVPSTEPTTWDVQAAQGTAAVLDRLRIRIDPGNTGAAPGEVDEIRIGTDWASVTVPEPGTAGLIGFAALSLGLRRRRRTS